MILTVQERMQFQYLLPVQGNFKTLEMVEGILKKVFVEDLNENEKEYSFDREQIQFLRMNIQSLDQVNKLSYSSLSLIRKIMEEII